MHHRMANPWNRAGTPWHARHTAVVHRSVPVPTATAAVLMAGSPPRRLRAAGCPARLGASPCTRAAGPHRRRFRPGWGAWHPDLGRVDRPTRRVPRGRQDHLAVARDPRPGARGQGARPVMAARRGLWSPPIGSGKMVVHPPRGVHAAAREPVRPAPAGAHAAPWVRRGRDWPSCPGWGLGGGIGADWRAARSPTRGRSPGPAARVVTAPGPVPRTRGGLARTAISGWRRGARGGAEPA